ncbi:MAG: helix-turn-helix domain-containing protein [Candidatus Binatia bacterium]
MISKPIEQINSADLDALLTGPVPEGRTLDYKRDLPGSTDADKKEFLADVSSFANTVGGDLIFGIEEAAGVPTAIVGLGQADLDAQQLRLDSMILTGIEPRIPYRLRALTASNGVPVLILRVEQSWEAPHRVIFKQHDRFYGRSTAGKYALDTGELRQAFLRTASIEEAIARFRDERLVEIHSGRSPVNLPGPGRLVLHLVPLEAIAGRRRFSLASLQGCQGQLRPMGTNGWNSRITLHGFMTVFNAGAEAWAYTHLYRSGIIEAVDGFILNRELSGTRVLPSALFERQLLEATKDYVAVQRNLGIAPPIYCFLSLLGAKGLIMDLGARFFPVHKSEPLSDDVVPIPESVLTVYDEGPEKLLREPIDTLWNAFGYEKSPNFDASGLWKPRN